MIAPNASGGKGFAAVVAVRRIARARVEPAITRSLGGS